jgi:hypothetical protein
MNTEFEIAIAWRATVSIAVRRNRERLIQGLASLEGDLAILQQDGKPPLAAAVSTGLDGRLNTLSWCEFEALRRPNSTLVAKFHVPPPADHRGSWVRDSTTERARRDSNS